MVLTPRPVLGAPQAQDPSLKPQLSPLELLRGTQQVRTFVLQESKSSIPLLLGAGTLNCKVPPQQMGPSHTLPRVTLAKNANQCDPRACADAESARNNLPRAPCPQDILKVRPPNSLDYRARYDTPALPPSVFSSFRPPCFCQEGSSIEAIQNQNIRVPVCKRFSPIELVQGWGIVA